MNGESLHLSSTRQLLNSLRWPIHVVNSVANTNYPFIRKTLRFVRNVGGGFFGSSAILLDYQFLYLILVFWAILFLFRLDFTKYFNDKLNDETKYVISDGLVTRKELVRNYYSDGTIERF